MRQQEVDEPQRCNSADGCLSGLAVGLGCLGVMLMGCAAIILCRKCWRHCRARRMCLPSLAGETCKCAPSQVE